MRNGVGNFRYAFRQFRKAPIFTVTAVLTLALGIGGTCAIFTLIHAVMLRSLPVSDPARLYRVGSGSNCCVQGGLQEEWGMFSFPLYERLKAETPEFEEVTAFQAGRGRFSVRREGAETAARPVRSEYVSGSYFSTLGVKPYGGRLLTPDDDRAAAPPVVVLSHRAWQMNYAGDPSVVGSIFAVEGHSFTVVGITPPGFFGEMLQSDPPDIWVPLQQEPLIDGDSNLLRQPVSAWLRMIGRLRPGATVDGMSPRLTGLLRQWMQNDAGYPANWMPGVLHDLPKQSISVVPAGAGVSVMKEQYERSLQILLSVCGFVLLIACANVSNLQLVRAAGRRGQTAVRLAVGASRRQIIREALTESVLLAVGGGAAGVVVAFAAAQLLLSLAFRHARFLPISAVPSLPTLGFAFALSLVTGVVFGVAPAWFATRTDPAEALRGTGRGTTDRAGFARRTLLIVQATLSVALVAGSMMLARSLNRLEAQDFGYLIPGRVIVALHNPAASASGLAKLNALYRQLEEKLNRLPGVQGSGLALYNPLTDNWGEGILVEGHPEPKPGEDSGSSWDRVSTDYLKNFGVRLVRGRYFTPQDNENGERVAVVNERFVKKFFPNGEDPIDRHFGLNLPENAGTFRIIGIVRDAKFASWGLREPAQPMFYAPLAQSVDYRNDLMRMGDMRSHFIGGLMLLTNQPTGVLLPALTRMLGEIDANITLVSVRTMEEQVALTFDQERAVATLAGLFGIVALTLSAIGLYGVTAYSITQRTNEIGIRMALGAGRGNVVQLILRGAFSRVLLGLILGLPLAVGAGRLISAQLYGVSPWDPAALAAAAGALTLSSFLAAIIPATRAALISPMLALRTE
jgi:predicted permease